MYHSITFLKTSGEYANTWDQWHLIPSSRPTIAPPAVKKNIVDIPGADGGLDLSEVLAGRPLYSRRTGQVDFYLQQGYWDWSTAYSTIMRWLHGRTAMMILEDDPGYVYEGRFFVNNFKSNPEYSQIVLEYDLAPYKRIRFDNADTWEWDPFNFETGRVPGGWIDLPVSEDATEWTSVSIEGNGFDKTLYIKTSKALNLVHSIGETRYPELTVNPTNDVFVPVTGVTIQNGSNTISVHRVYGVEGAVTFSLRYDEVTL